MKLLIRREAEQDIHSAHAWYQQQSPRAARRFLKAIDHTLERVVQFPQAFPLVGGTTRRALLERFPYAVYFCENENRVEVHAVFQQRRQVQPRLIR